MSAALAVGLFGLAFGAFTLALPLSSAV